MMTEEQNLVKEGSEEFKRRCAGALAQVAEKYAWTAQQRGMILRNNPLKLQPMDDYVFNRISKAEYGFYYVNSRNRKRKWYPDATWIVDMCVEEDDALDVDFKIAERIAFLPGQPEISTDDDLCRVLNLWRPPQWAVDAQAVEPAIFLDHLNYLVGDDQVTVSHLLDFMAHMVQKPRERIGHALLITSAAKGIGKSTLGIVLRKLVGERNSGVAQTKDLKGQFDGWLVGKLLIQVDEVYEAGNWDLANKLKPLLTEPEISVNVKYGPQMQVENYARFIMFSNHSAPLNIEEGDRRYFVIDSPAQPKEQDYYDRLYAFIDSPEGMTSIYTFLMKRDLSSFNAHRPPPMTAAKSAIIKTSGNPLRNYIQDCVDSGHFHQEFNGMEFTFDELQRVLTREGYGSHCKNVRELGQALDNAGVVKERKRVGGKRMQVYTLPHSGLMTEAEMPENIPF